MHTHQIRFLTSWPYYTTISHLRLLADIFKLHEVIAGYLKGCRVVPGRQAGAQINKASTALTRIGKGFMPHTSSYTYN